VRQGPSLRMTNRWPKSRMLRDHGQIQKYYHEVERVQRALGRHPSRDLHAKLKYLSEWTEARRSGSFSVP